MEMATKNGSPTSQKVHQLQTNRNYKSKMRIVSSQNEHRRIYQPSKNQTKILTTSGWILRRTREPGKRNEAEEAAKQKHDCSSKTSQKEDRDRKPWKILANGERRHQNDQCRFLRRGRTAANVSTAELNI